MNLIENKRFNPTVFAPMVFVAMLALAGCESQVSASKPSMPPGPLSSSEATCNGRLNLDEQGDVIRARQNDARHLLSDENYTDAEMRAAMDSFCDGIIPPQQ